MNDDFIEANSIITKQKMLQYLGLIAPQEKFEPEALGAVVEHAHEFFINVLEQSCQLASIKENKLLEPTDIYTVLFKLYDIHLPPTEQLPIPRQTSKYSKTETTNYDDDVHIKRLREIRQAMQ